MMAYALYVPKNRVTSKLAIENENDESWELPTKSLARCKTKSLDDMNIDPNEKTILHNESIQFPLVKFLLFIAIHSLYMQNFTLKYFIE